MVLLCVKLFLFGGLFAMPGVRYSIFRTMYCFDDVGSVLKEGNEKYEIRN